MSERYSTWDSYGMKQGSIYRYIRQGRTLYSGDLIDNTDYLGFEHEIGQVDKDDIIVYLDRIVIETKYEALSYPTTTTITLIKVLVQDGIVGWMYWNVGDWEKVD